MRRERLDRQIFLIAESADNNARLIRPREPAATVSTRNGMTIFIIACAHS